MPPPSRDPESGARIPQPWGQHRIMITASDRFVLEVDAANEIARLKKELALAQADSQAAFALAEQLQLDLGNTKVAMETLRALASMSLNKSAEIEASDGTIPSDAQAEAQAWAQNYNDLQRKAIEAGADQALLAFVLSSFSSSANDDWHWLHAVVRGPSPRAALEAAMLSPAAQEKSGVLTSQPQAVLESEHSA